MDSVDRIVDAATELFAAHGFHETTTRQIAAATGLNIATVHHHVGTKRELYERVLQRLHDDDLKMVQGFAHELNGATQDDAAALRDTLLHLVDSLLDRTHASPRRLRLYMRRWLEPQDDLTETESNLSLDLYRPVYELLDAARRRGLIDDGIDLLIFLRSFDWMMYGYFIGGPMSLRSLREDPHDDVQLARFRDYVHAYICRMLGLQPRPDTKE